MNKRKEKRRNKNNAMYAKYGEHSPGVYCGGCRNCQKRERDDGRWTWKCLAYGVTGTYETDWSPKFTACGFFNMPFNSYDDTPLIKTDSHKRIVNANKHSAAGFQKSSVSVKGVSREFKKIGGCNEG